MVDIYDGADVWSQLPMVDTYVAADVWSLFLPEDLALLLDPDAPLLEWDLDKVPCPLPARVVKFCEQLYRGDDTAVEKLRASGQYLHEQGGLPLMQECYEEVMSEDYENKFAPLLNRGWDGVGDWTR